MTEKQKIICNHVQGKSNRRIASELHISKNTVNKYVREYDDAKAKVMAEDPGCDNDEIVTAIIEKPKYDSTTRKRRKVSEDILSLVDECLEENKMKISTGKRKQIMKGMDIWEYVCNHGHDISYSTICSIIREKSEIKEEAFIRQTYNPGECCEFDWGEVKLKIGGNSEKTYQLAVFTPPYSDIRFAKLYEHQDTAAFLSSHVDFIQFSGGVFHQMTYDNMRVAVRKFVGFNEKEPTEALLGISAYYGFSFRFCNIHSGNEKGSVERSVEFVRRKAFSAPGKDIFETLEAANEYLMDKMIELSKKDSGEGRNKYLLFEDEKKRLLPILPKYPCYKKQHASVDKYSTFSYDTNHYSVPESYVGKEVEIRIYTDYITAFYDGNQIARHVRKYGKDQWTIDIYHYLHTLKKKPGALTRSTALLQADTQTKNIYCKYYSKNNKEFLQILSIIKEKGVTAVSDALQALELLSPGDYSVDKVKTVCEVKSGIGESGPTSDHLSEVSKTMLVNYDLLMALSQKKAGASNG